MKAKKISVLVIEASSLLRKKLTSLINHTMDCEVIAIARDGYEALSIISTLKPDVIILDLQLSKMDGIICLEYIMSEWPTPVIVLSTFAKEESAKLVEALEYGAVDFITKIDGDITQFVEAIREELISKIRMAANIEISKVKLVALEKIQKLRKKPQIPLIKIIAIGASTGGPSAVTQILNRLPGNLEAGIIVIQHMPSYFIKSFAERLDQHSELKVKVAKEGDEIETSKVLVAPAGYQMRLISSQNSKRAIVSLKIEEANVRRASPCIDITFASIAQLFRSNTIGLILTGMGRDGTLGCSRIKAVGGITFAQSESSCIVYGMPGSAVAAGVIDEILPIEQIPHALLSAVRGH